MKETRTWVIGDIHGAAKALLQIIERSGADIEKDTFIVLGDVTDGWPEVPEAIEILMSIKNLIYITGNHDIWAREFLVNPTDPQNPQIANHYMSWYTQGGKATADAYKRRPELTSKHVDFLNDSLAYYVDDQNRLYIHGGYDPKIPIDEQTEFDIAWDRRFWTDTRAGRNLGITYDEVYIGHSPTIRYPKNDGSHKQPLNYGKVWNLDTGGAYTGMLSIMDVDTKEVFQSDVVKTLYPNHEGR
jgi:serine/threonine protein phosphatase 1